jgi:large subunit ribosomal protein L1
MEKNNLIKTVQELKSTSQKRNFKQTVDLIVTLKNFDLKKTPLDFYVDLHNPKGKRASVCCLVGPEMREEAKECDEVILSDDFKKYQEDKKLTKKLAAKHDFFLAQANLMAQVATTFGRILGSRGKMPNPKAGCVIPPKTPIKPLYLKLQKLLRIRTKGGAFIHAVVGAEDMPDEQIADNIFTAYNALVHHLPAEENNISNIRLKLTMSKPVKINTYGNIIKEHAEEEAEGKKKKGSK